MARNSDFDHSIAYFKNLINIEKKRKSNNLSYYFYYFAVFSYFLNDIEDYSYEKEYQEFFKQSSLLFEKKLSKLKKENQKNNRSLQNSKKKKIDKEIIITSFYYGGILGFKGLYEINFNNWWDAFFLGNSAVKLLKKSIQSNSFFYEPYYGLGLYYYWKGVKAKDLWYIPFIEDSREKGIKALTISLKKSDIVRVESQISLIRIGINEMDDQMIAKYSKGFFEKYPDNIYLNRHLVLYYHKKKDYQKMKFYLDHLTSLKKKYSKYNLTLFSMFLNYYYALFYFNTESDLLKSKDYLEKNLQKKRLNNKRGNIIFNNYLKMSQKLREDVSKKNNN